MCKYADLQMCGFVVKLFVDALILNVICDPLAADRQPRRLHIKRDEVASSFLLAMTQGVIYTSADLHIRTSNEFAYLHIYTISLRQ